jgi:hypothetical protein
VRGIAGYVGASTAEHLAAVRRELARRGSDDSWIRAEADAGLRMACAVAADFTGRRQAGREAPPGRSFTCTGGPSPGRSAIEPPEVSEDMTVCTR